MRIHRGLRDFHPSSALFLGLLVLILSSELVNCGSLDLAKVFELPICCYTRVVGNQAEHSTYFGTRNQTVPVRGRGQDISDFENVLATTSSNVQKQIRTDTDRDNDSEPASRASASAPTTVPNSALQLQFDSSRFYKLIVPFSTVKSSGSQGSEPPRLIPLRRKREAVQKTESAKAKSAEAESTAATTEGRSIAAFNDFDSVYTPFEDDTVQLPSNWLTRLQSALFQSMIMQNITSNASLGVKHEETASWSPNSRSAFAPVPEEMAKNLESLWQKIANASWEVIEPYTKRVIAKLPTTISGKITGVMVNNPNGIQLHMSTTSNKMKRTVDAEAHMEISRATRQLDGLGGANPGAACDCHLIHHGDIPLAYYSVAHTQNEVGNDQLEYLVFPVTYNVPTPPRVQKFVSNDLTVIHRPSEVDYTAEVMKMNQKRTQNQNPRLRRPKKQAYKHPGRNQFPKQQRLRQEISHNLEHEDESKPPQGAYPSVPDILREMQPYISPASRPSSSHQDHGSGQHNLESAFPYEFNQEPYQHGTEASPSYSTSYYSSHPDQKSAHEHSSQQLQPFVYPSPRLPGGYFHFYHQKQQVVQPPINSALFPDAQVPPPSVFLPPPHRFYLDQLPHPPPHPFLIPNYGLGAPNNLPLPLPPPYLAGPGGPQIPRPQPQLPPSPLSNHLDGFGGSQLPPAGAGEGQIPPLSEFDYPKSIQEIISTPHQHRFQIPGSPFGFGYNSTRLPLRGDKQYQQYNDLGFDPFNDCRDDAQWGTGNANGNTKRRRMIPTSALAASIATSERLQRCRERYIRSRYASPNSGSNYQDQGKSSSGNSNIRFPNDNEILGSDHATSELPNSKVVTASYTVDF